MPDTNAQNQPSRPVDINPQNIVNFSQLSTTALANLGYQPQYNQGGQVSQVTYVPKPNPQDIINQQSVQSAIQQGQFTPQQPGLYDNSQVQGIINQFKAGQPNTYIPPPGTPYSTYVPGEQFTLQNAQTFLAEANANNQAQSQTQFNQLAQQNQQGIQQGAIQNASGQLYLANYFFSPSATNPTHTLQGTSEFGSRIGTFLTSDLTVISKTNPVSIVTGEIKMSDIKNALFIDDNSLYGEFNKIGYKIFNSKTLYNIGSFEGKVEAQFFPTTPLDIATTIELPDIYAKLPSAFRIATSGIISYKGAEQALNPNITPEERVAGGIIGGLGAFGLASETLPYARGIAYRFKFNPDFHQVTTAYEGFKAVDLTTPKNLPSVIKLNEYTGTGQPVAILDIPPEVFSYLEKAPQDRDLIGLIPRGSPLKTGETADINLPDTSPLVRGGFERIPGGEQKFIGKNQLLATSQIGFFNEGTDIPLLREFFVTPQEPNINIFETRLSRLGLNEGLFSFPDQTQIGFGFQGKAQIGLTTGNVARVEGTFAYELGKGTELEAIKSYGTIQNVRRIGFSSIKGQGVELYSFDLAPGTPSKNAGKGTSIGKTRVSGESILSVISQRIAKATSTQISSKTASIKIPTTSVSTRPTTTLKITSFYTSSGSSKAIPTFSPPIIKGNTFGSIPKSSSIFIPKSPPSFSPPKINFNPLEESGREYPRQTYGSKSKDIFGNFNLFVKRKGKFRYKGSFPSISIAEERGVDITAKTLARSFRITGGQAGLPPGYRFSKAKGQKDVFVELGKNALNTPTEISEIELARAMKGGRRKK